MQKLNFPEYRFRLKSSENKIAAFDEIRKKFVVLTPEEWVRLHTVQYLMNELGFPKSLINVEKQLKLGERSKRYDIVVFRQDGGIRLVVECKAPSVPISQATFDQIATYNMQLQADLLMVTNGLSHYFCKIDYKAEKYIFLRELPPYQNSPPG